MKTHTLPFVAAARRAAAAVMIALAPVGAALLPVTPARAQAFGTSVVQAEILPGWTAPDGTRIAALHLRMVEGWHTYWRIPGEAGIAPQLDWSRSQNVAAVTPIWPRPQIFRQNGLLSIGYEDELILPLAITPGRPGRAMALTGELTIGVCRETCVPVDLTVQAALRGEGAPDARIAEAMQAQAVPGERAGLTRATCRLEPSQRGADLTLRATLPRTGRDEHIVMELPDTGYWISDSRTWREGDELVAQARVRAPQRGAVSIDRSALSFTVLSEGRMVSGHGCIGG